MDRKKFEYKKAVKYIDRIIEKATLERDYKGYRENLGLVIQYEPQKDLNNNT